MVLMKFEGVEGIERDSVFIFLPLLCFYQNVTTVDLFSKRLSNYHRNTEKENPISVMPDLIRHPVIISSIVLIAPLRGCSLRIDFRILSAG